MSRFFPIEKSWGWVYRLPGPSGSECHVAYIHKGQKSSWHAHANMVNTFFVVTGRLRITQATGVTRTLGPCDVLTVETGNFHKFESLEDTVLVEFYGTVDINRSKTT